MKTENEYQWEIRRLETRISELHTKNAGLKFEIEVLERKLHEIQKETNNNRSETGQISE